MWNPEPSWNAGLTKVHPIPPASSYYTEEIREELVPGVSVAYRVEYRRYVRTAAGPAINDFQQYRKQCLCWTISIPGANNLRLVDVPSIGTCREIAEQLVKAHHRRTFKRVEAKE